MKFIYQYAAGLSSSLVFVSTAMHGAWTSPSLPLLLDKNSSIPITSSQGSWIAVAPLIGSPIGCIVSALLADRIGRKSTLLITSPLLFSTWIIIAYASSVFILIFARILAGIAIGFIHTVHPMYIGEVADRKIRGFLGSLTEAAARVGVLVMNISGIYAPIKESALLASIIPILHFVTFVIVPESPRFFILKKNEKKAADSLKKLTSTKNVDTEMSELTARILSQSQDPKVSLTTLTSSGNKKALMVMLGLILLQHCSGFLPIIQYCLTIFKEANGTIDDGTATIIYCVIQLLATISSSVLVDLTGRKPLLIISVIGTSVALAVKCTFFYLKNKTSVDVSSLGYLPLMALIVYTISGNLGVFTIAFMMMSELFPTNIKAFALCFCNIFFNLFGIVVTRMFQIVKDEYGVHVPFFIFSLCSAVGLIFIIFVVPETKRKTLEQIQLKLNKQRNTREPHCDLMNDKQ